MEQNKTGKYFKYAIGEIVLVVIGILIALQINNWNGNKKEQAKESSYQKNLQRDLNDQINYIDNQITYETNFINAASYLITNFNSNSTKNIDSTFFTKLSDLHTRKTFVITDPTYTDLLSSGNINLIKNEKFKDRLIQYYQELERIEKVIHNNNTLLVDQQFASIFLDIGYYFSNNLAEPGFHAKVKSLELTSIYNQELETISKKILLIPENKLRLMNVINVRHTISTAHLGYMQISKQSTQKLIEELNDIIHD